MKNQRLLALGTSALLLCACAAKTEPPVTLLAAAADLEEGAVLESTRVVEVAVPKALATANTVAPAALKPLLGSHLRLPIRKGDLLLLSYLEAEDARVATLVQKKGRAVTVPVSGAEGLHASDRVDVLSVVKDAASGEWVAVTILQNVLVLTPGKPDPSTAEQNKGFALRRVTFMVLPEEAEILLLAVKNGAVDVTVRNPEDVDVQEERGRATLNTVLTGERMKALRTLRLRTIDRPAAAPAAAPAE